jgi:hypothetical protein
VGVAGWASRAELDELIVDGVRERLALVPSWQPFVAFLALAAVAIAGLAAVLRRAAPRTRAPRLGEVVLPVLALAVLAVPYLPVIPDWWPGLQVLAGPGFWMVWALVGVLLLWTIAPQAPAVSRWWGSRSRRTQTAVVWLVTAAAATAGAARLTHTVLFPSGDEPHYLVIAQSLWRDGDLRIENNHRRKDYAEYFGRDLDPHYLTRGKDGEIYSIHPVGMPVLMTPVYAIGGYDLVLAAFIAMAATAAAVAWRWVAATTAALGTTTLAWAAVVLSAPFLLNAFTIYPEVPAGLAVALGLALALPPTADRRPWHDAAIGTLAGVLPWLSTKYAPMSAALLAVALARRWWPMHASETHAGALRASIALVMPYAVSVAAWFAFFYAIWGRLSPSAPYGPMTQTELGNTLFGVPGLLFDQEYGLLVYAPGYVLAGFGFWTMLRRPGPLRRLGLEVLIVFGALIVTVGAFRIWWGGSAAPGRPLTSGLAILMLPMAVQLGTAAPGSARRAAQHLLIWLGVCIAALLVTMQDGLLIANDRDGTSSMLAWLSPRWPLWTLAPTFIAHEAPRALTDAAVWLVLVAAGSFALARLRTPSRGVAALAALGASAAALVAGAATVRALPAASRPLPDIDLRARARLDSLDTFDHTTRPFAVRYRPLLVEPAVDAERALSVGVTPGLRTAPQPLRVLHNGRFSLPAGRYRVVVTWATRDPLPAGAGATVALQIGRIGPPFATWTVDPVPGGSFEREFWLPIDAAFVGLRGSSEVERSIAAIDIHALDVVDAGVRTPTPQVLSAAAYRDVLIYFHDELMYPESAGFWTTGERLARLTIACPGGCSRGVTLRVHSGGRPNQLRLSTQGWSRALELAGGPAIDVPVPPPSDGGVIELDTMTTSGFRPADLDPANRDRRYLGAWIEVHLPAEEGR